MLVTSALSALIAVGLRLGDFKFVVQELKHQSSSVVLNGREGSQQFPQPFLQKPLVGLALNLKEVGRFNGWKNFLVVSQLFLKSANETAQRCLVASR